MPGPRVKGKRSSAVQLRAAHVRPLQSGSLLAVRLKAADVTAAVKSHGRIWNPPLRSCCRGRRPRRPVGAGHARPARERQAFVLRTVAGRTCAAPTKRQRIGCSPKSRGRDRRRQVPRADMESAPYGAVVGGGVPDAPQAVARSKSITSHYILYSFAEFCYNGSIPFIIGHFEGVIL